MQHRGNAYDPSIKPTDVKRPSAFEVRYQKLFKRQLPQRAASTPDTRPLARLFSFGGPRGSSHQPPGQDIALEAYRELDFRKAEFFHYLDKELAKIENFYEEEEDKAVERLKVLREQLHTMRERRLLDVKAAEAKKSGYRHLSTIANVADKVGKTSRSMAQLGTPPLPAIEPGQPGSAAQQDYVRKHQVS
jgi:hypothetical protein